MGNQKVYDMSFAKVYPLLVTKAARKGCKEKQCIKFSEKDSG